MKAPLTMLLIAGLAASSVVHADPGVNLSWDACSPEGGIQSKTFACNSNSGTRSMWGSFILSGDQPNFVGIEATIDIQAQSDSLPAWWQFKNAGACRASALTVNFDFTSDPATACTDPWSGQAIGGLAGYFTYWTPGADLAPNVSQLRFGAAVPSTSPISLTAGTEYYCFKLNLSSAKTVGSGSCGGCSTPVCIVLSKISAVQNDGTQEDLTSAITSNILSWQSGATCSGGNIPQNITWGQIRSVLR